MVRHLHTFYFTLLGLALLVVSVVFSFSSRFARFMDGDSVIYRNSSRVSQVFYDSTLVGYIVSLEFVNGAFMYVYTLSSVLYMDMPSVFFLTPFSPCFFGTMSDVGIHLFAVTVLCLSDA